MGVAVLTSASGEPRGTVRLRHEANAIISSYKRLGADAWQSESVAHRCSFAIGTKVRLSAEGCDVPKDYNWHEDALAPGDVGEVTEIDGNSDLRIRGASGKEDWY